jgi:hypothetical protein
LGIRLKGQDRWQQAVEVGMRGAAYLEHEILRQLDATLAATLLKRLDASSS